MEPGGPSKRLGAVQTYRPIISALGIVAIIFGVSVVVTLAAGRYGYSAPMVGWFSLIAMIGLTWQARGALGRLLLGDRRLPAL